MNLRTLGMLDRAGLRKIATDCGFDVLEDRAELFEAASTQSPLRAWIGLSGEGPVLGLSMASVLKELHAAPMVVPVSVPAAAGWIQLTDWGSLDRALLQAWHLSRALPNQLEKRYADRLSKLSSTEREATVRQRIGQDLFREGLLTLWQGQCAISGLKVPELLRASHAKPWAASTDAERLDVFNGILLAAHLDAAFDCGMIAIDAAGVVETRSDLSLEVTRILGVNSATRVAISDQHKPYFAWHRKNIFGRG
jgi:putative restriction endonuclease